MDLTINSKLESVDPTVKVEQLDNTTATSDGVVPGGESSAFQVTDQTQLEISEDGYETVMIKDEPRLSDSGRLEQRRGSVRVQSPSSEECNEGRVVTRSTDDVAEHDESLAQPLPLFRDDNINQSEGSLHPNQVSPVRQSTEAPPENPQSSREGSKTHTCGVCKKQFDLKGSLVRHVRIHTGEKSFQCEICNAAFSRRYSLETHQRLHSGEKPYKCEEEGCYSAFSDLSNLRAHQRTHSREKPYKCEEEGCYSAFSDPSNLRAHRRTHSAEKPYKCEEKGCNSAFRRSSHLTYHQRTHSDERLFMCDICNESFRQKSTLTVHMVIHSGRKAHKCNVCEKEFSRKSTLTWHHKIHLKKKPSQL